MPRQEPARWLSADDPGNPFDVAVLDLMVTQKLIATSKDQEQAARSISWRGKLGDELDAREVLKTKPIDCAIELPAAAVLPDGLLFTPDSMDVKWVIAWRDGQIIAARSWTGTVEAVAEATHDGRTLTIRRIYASEESPLRSGDLRHTFEWFLRSHALGEKLPFPADEETTELLAEVPTLAFSFFGNVIFCAAHEWDPDPATKPLRSDGRVLAALRNEDREALAAAVRAGEDIDAESTSAGYTALHLAVVRGDLGLFEFLIDLGASPETIADRQTHALHIACVHKAPLEIFDAIAGSDLDLCLPNEDGFTALHAAAETDYADAVPWLVEHGLELEARTKPGHTPLHIAAALGHAAAAHALLDAGADPQASSRQGTPLDVARSEGKDETIALLTSLPRK